MCNNSNKQRDKKILSLYVHSYTYKHNCVQAYVIGNKIPQDRVSHFPISVCCGNCVLLYVGVFIFIAFVFHLKHENSFKLVVHLNIRKHLCCSQLERSYVNRSKSFRFQLAVKIIKIFFQQILRSIVICSGCAIKSKSLIILVFISNNFQHPT